MKKYIQKLAITKKVKNKYIKNHELGELYFGQLNVYHQEFFDIHNGQHTRVRLRDLPHYIFWRDGEYKKPAKSLYHAYLKESWKYYYPQDNTEKKRNERINTYIELKDNIAKKGVLDPIQIVIAPDEARVIVSGNHRASIAYHLGIDVPYEEVDLEIFIKKITLNEGEFYGTKRAGVPYQSIFYKDKELIQGRRRDVLERFYKMDIVNDIRGKAILDIGSNVAINSMLAWHFGAKNVTAAERSPIIGTSALKLSTLFDAEIGVKVQDLGVLIKKAQVYDTVFCFSLYAHVKEKDNFEKNIVRLTGKTLYFEGHQRRNKKDYQHIFKHFKKVKQIGFNRDGIHSKEATRPFFKCEK